MKKFLIIFFITSIFVLPVFPKEDRTTEEYLKQNKHISLMNFAGEHLVTKAIKQALKKEAPGKYHVKFKGYTLSSIKKGIFSYLEITGENVLVEDEIKLPYFNIKTTTDYNWIDYNQNPVVFKSDMDFDCIIHLSDTVVNKFIKEKDYQKVLDKVNKKAYPLFKLTGVMVKIKNDRLHTIMSYNFPLAPKEKDRTFMVTSKLKIVNNEIFPDNVSYNSVYGNLPIQKVINLINMVNPMNFVVKMADSKQSKAKIKEIKIVDDVVIINGTIHIKGEDK